VASAFGIRFFGEVTPGWAVPHPGLENADEVSSAGPSVGILPECVEGLESTAWVRNSGVPAEDASSVRTPQG